MNEWVDMFSGSLYFRGVYLWQDFPGGSAGKQSACNVGDLFQPLGWEDPLKNRMATHSSILAWRIPGTV